MMQVKKLKVASDIMCYLTRHSHQAVL